MRGFCLPALSPQAHPRAATSLLPSGSQSSPTALPSHRSSQTQPPLATATTVIYCTEAQVLRVFLSMFQPPKGFSHSPDRAPARWKVAVVGLLPPLPHQCSLRRQGVGAKILHVPPPPRPCPPCWGCSGPRLPLGHGCTGGAAPRGIEALQHPAQHGVGECICKERSRRCSVPPLAAPINGGRGTGCTAAGDSGVTPVPAPYP